MVNFYRMREDHMSVVVNGKRVGKIVKNNNFSFQFRRTGSTHLDDGSQIYLNQVSAMEAIEKRLGVSPL